MYAVIRTGGKQYRVQEGSVLRVEKLSTDPGAPVEFNEVLLVGKGEQVQLGSPLTVLGHGKARKVMVIKFKRRKNYMRNKGHRQAYTEVRINTIGAAKAPAKRKKKAAAKTAETAEQEG